MNEELAIRLITAHPSVPWRSPLVATEQGKPVRDHETGVLWRCCGSGWRPDLDDAATAGVLLATVRRVWDAPRLAAHWFAGTDDLPRPFRDPGWIVDLGDGENVVCGATAYAEALVCAIEDRSAVGTP